MDLHISALEVVESRLEAVVEEIGNAPVAEALSLESATENYLPRAVVQETAGVIASMIEPETSKQILIGTIDLSGEMSREVMNETLETVNTMFGNVIILLDEAVQETGAPHPVPCQASPKIDPTSQTTSQHAKQGLYLPLLP